MTNKEIVYQYMQGFRESNHAMILACLTDDIEWEMPGYFHLTGLEAFDAEIENDNFTGSPEIHLFRLTEERDVVIAEGSVKATFKTGDLLNAVFCDVFEMKNGKIRKLTTYQMNK